MVAAKLELAELEGLQMSEEYGQYLKDGLAFYQFSEVVGLDQSRFVEAAYLDSCSAHYVKFVYQCKASRNECKHALLALQRQFTHSLPRGWKALAGWNELKGKQSRTPLLFDILQILVRAAFDLAFMNAFSPSLLWTFAVLVQVGFGGLLRPKSIVSLMRCDVMFSGDTGFFAQHDAICQKCIRCDLIQSYHFLSDLKIIFKHV